MRPRYVEFVLSLGLLLAMPGWAGAEAEQNLGEVQNKATEIQNKAEQAGDLMNQVEKRMGSDGGVGEKGIGSDGGVGEKGIGIGELQPNAAQDLMNQAAQKGIGVGENGIGIGVGEQGIGVGAMKKKTPPVAAPPR